MKKLFFFWAVLTFLNQSAITAQELSFSAVYSNSIYNRFQNNVGYEISYFQHISTKAKFGVSFTHCFNSFNYNYTFFSGTDGIDYYRQIKPSNQNYKFAFAYGYNMLNKDKSDLYIGPKMAINFFNINEKITENVVNESVYLTYNSHYWYSNKIGMGFFIEYNRNILSDKIKAFVSAAPELIYISNPLLMGSSEPSLVAWFNINAGLKINFAKMNNFNK